MYLSNTIFFQTTRQENPDTVCGTKDMALQQIAQINTLLTEADRVEMRKSFGLREDLQPTSLHTC